jgi:hypothetical protein
MTYTPGFKYGYSPVAIPFLKDTDTYWYEFKNTTSSVVDDFAFNSMSYAADKVNGNRFWQQPVKDYQPFYTSNRGISFGNLSGRFMKLYPLPGFMQNKAGTFFACNVFTNGYGTLLTLSSFEIAGARGKFSIASNYKPEIKMAANGTDTGTSTLIKTATNALEPNTWYTLAFLIDRTNDICKIYVNGVVVDTSTTSSPYSNTEDFVLKNALLGADGIEGATGTTFDGIISDMILQDSLQLSYIDSQLSYLQASRLDIPDAPVIVANTANAGVNIVFTAPNPHNDSITDYNYQYKLSSSGTWIDFGDGTSGVAGTTVTGLTNDSLYDFRVRAVNTIGFSAWSSSVQGTPTANPGPPDAVVLTTIPSSTQVRMVYVQPGTNGYAITAYKNYYKQSSSGTWILFNTTTTPETTVTGLTNGVAYDFSVICTNSQGDSVRSNISSGTPGITDNLQNVDILLASCVMDIDLRHSACYNGSGITLNNLVTVPADGAAQSDYNLQFGDGTTTTTYPTFSGTPGSESAKLTLDGGDFLTLVGDNTPFFNNLHKNIGGSGFTIVAFFENVNAITSGSQTVFSNNSTATQGMTGYLNSAEFLRMDQRGDANTVSINPGNTNAVVASSRTYLAYSSEPNATQVGGTRQSFWNSATGASTPLTTNSSYNGTVVNPSFKMTFMKRASGTASAMANGTVLKSICTFNTRLSSAAMAKLVEEMNNRHGVTY